MLEIVTLWAGAATTGCAVLTYLWRSACIDRDEARADLTVEKHVSKALENRVTNLRADNIVLAKDNDLLSAKTVEQSREIGRLQAEQRATKPVRGPDGRFASKTKPIAYG